MNASDAMNTTGTVADAHEYWRRYYAEQFRFGLGTEDILATLMQVPPVDSWVDLGSGSESMLWAIGLRARRLTAVDADTQRLDILQQFVATGQPRGVHITALRLCGRTDPGEFTARCRSLSAVIKADCLTGPFPADSPLTPGSFELVTQFGLLGLCRDDEHFTASFARLHRLLAPGGWTAGANWVSRDQHDRVELTESLYRATAARAGVRLALLHRIASADPDFPAVWIYVGHTTSPARRTSPCPPLQHPAN